MARSPKQQKRRVDIACGYSFACFACVSLFWVLSVLKISAAGVCLVMGAIGCLPAVLRSLFLPLRFVVVPVLTLGYVVLIVALSAMAPAVVIPNSDSFRFVVLATGLAYSVIGLPLIVRLWSRDFAKPMPAWECHDCGYPLFGLTQPICPECGKPFDPAKVPAMPSPEQAGGVV